MVMVNKRERRRKWRVRCAREPRSWLGGIRYGGLTIVRPLYVHDSINVWSSMTNDEIIEAMRRMIDDMPLELVYPMPISHHGYAIELLYKVDQGIDVGLTETEVTELRAFVAAERLSIDVRL